MGNLLLKFNWDLEPLLQEADFQHHDLRDALGNKVTGCLNAVATLDFPWSRGPQSLCLLLLDAKARTLRGARNRPLFGDAGKPLHELLKKPSDIASRRWPVKILGFASDGEPLISKIVINGGTSKKPAPVLNLRALSPDELSVECDGRVLTRNVEAIELLGCAINDRYFTKRIGEAAARRQSWEQLRLSLPTASAIRTVQTLAVFPFRAAPEVTLDRFLLDGFCEDVIIRLTRLRGLYVLSPESTLPHRSEEQSLDALARSLGTTVYLNGSVRQEGDTLRLNVYLANTDSHRVIWANDYHFSKRNLFAAQSELASDVATELKGQLSASDSIGLRCETASEAEAEAYELYLTALAQSQENSEASIERARSLLARSINLNNRFPDAMALTGYCLWRKYFSGWSADMSVLQEALSWVNAAKAADPNCACAAVTSIRISWDLGQHKQALDEARQLWQASPESGQAMLAMARAYNNAGMAEKALPLTRRVLERDPTNPTARKLLVWNLCMTGEFEKTCEAGESYLDACPEDSNTTWAVTLSYMHRSNWNNAIKRAETGLKFDPTSVFLSYILGYAFRESGATDKAIETWREGARRAEQRLVGFEKNPRVQSWIAALHAAMGDKPRAVEQVRAVLSDCDAPNGYISYRLGCVWAELGRTQDSLACLKDAVERGFLSVQLMKQEQLMSLKKISRCKGYINLVTRLQNSVDALKERY